MADDNIIPFKGDGIVGDGAVIEPDLILENAKGNYQQVLVIGWNQEGELDMRCSHSSREALWLLRKGEHALLFETE